MKTNPYATSDNDVLGNFGLLTSGFFSVPAQKISVCQKRDPYRNDSIFIFVFFFDELKPDLTDLYIHVLTFRRRVEAIRTN